MKNLNSMNLIELTDSDQILIQGGGPIREALEWYYKTMGSFYRGVWDGLTGKDPML